MLLTDHEQISVQRLLKRKFEEARAKNPRFSVRAFAKRLGLSAGATNEILKGERRVSIRMADRLAERLALSPLERAEMLKPFAKSAAAAENADADDLLKLTADQFEVIAEWTHFAVLSLVKVKGFKDDSKWIAKRLGIRPDQARATVERLLRLKLLERAEAGLRRTSNRVQTSDDVLDLSIQRAHIEDLERVAKAIRELPVEYRDVSSITIPAHPKLFGRAKLILRQAQDQIADLMETQPATEVVRILTCMFPLTQIKEK